IVDRPSSFFYSYRAHRHLHSFPTRRSSDLPPVVLELVDAAGAGEGVEDGAFGDVVVLEDRSELVEQGLAVPGRVADATTEVGLRSEEHTSELQSRENLVCRLLLEKKKTY